MIYLDSNVFLHGSLSTDARGENSRKILTDVQNGKNPAATSALTYDEVFWVVKKHKGFDTALKAVEALLEMPNLAILPVDTDLVRQAHGLVKRYRLNPRDAIHAASALVHGISTVVTDDPDFDRIKEIKKRGLT